MEGFSDSVFAFAITLLIVSLEVPDNFGELLVDMRGFFGFAVCFGLLVSVWYEHYKFFRRFGLTDLLTIVLNAALLFIVLFYVFPVKFLFTLVTERLLGLGGEKIDPGQWPLLMVIYGAGFVAVQLVFVLLYLRAYDLRGVLELDDHELSIAREETQGYLINVVIGSASIAIAALGGVQMVAWAGWVYVLIFPLQWTNGLTMGSRRKQKVKAPPEDGPSEPGNDPE